MWTPLFLSVLLQDLQLEQLTHVGPGDREKNRGREEVVRRLSLVARQSRFEFEFFGQIHTVVF